MLVRVRPTPSLRYWARRVRASPSCSVTTQLTVIETGTSGVGADMRATLVSRSSRLGRRGAMMARSRHARELDGDVERVAGSAVVDALERGDVVVVAAARHEHVPLRDG